MDKVSIIIPFYNDSEHLPITLGSCLMQDYPVEVIVVNDGSTKFCPLDVMGYIDAIADEYVINSKNVGLAESRDAGIRKSTGEFIFPLDTQDFIYPKIMGKMVEAIKDADVVFGNMTIDNTGTIYPPPGKNGVTREGMMKCNQIWCSSLYRKSIIEKVGGYFNQIHTSYEDYTLNCKLLMAGARFKYIDILVYHHEQNPNSMLSKLHKDTDYYNELARGPLYG